MVVIICGKYGNNRSRTENVTEQTRFSKSRLNDLEDIGQCQRASHATHLLTLAIICTKYGKNPLGTVLFHSVSEQVWAKSENNWYEIWNVFYHEILYRNRPRSMESREHVNRKKNTLDLLTRLTGCLNTLSSKLPARCRSPYRSWCVCLHLFKSKQYIVFVITKLMQCE